jgi:DedD protein
MSDDGFHEIQLNGKQLIFLFMAATVVSVVIFLCGVLVGRGVRAERIAVQSAALSEAPTPEILPSAPSSSTPASQAGADPRTAAPPAPVDDLSYSDRVEKSSGVEADIRPDSVKAAEAKKAAATEPTTEKPSAPAPAPAASKADSVEKPQKLDKSAHAEKAPRPAPVPKPMPEPAAAVAKETTPPPSAATPGDYAVQVAAVNARGDADAIAKRFSSRGYTAYVEVPPNGTGTVFRVRIGTFKTKREAETIAAKLLKEEQIKPWVTR